MEYTEFSLEELLPFLAAHPGRGTLRVQVTMGDGAFPVERAMVEIFAMVQQTHLPIYRRFTDESGIVANLQLPASPNTDTQQQVTAADSVTLYTVGVSHGAYLPVPNRQVEIYDGIETILRVNLRPILR